MFVILQLKSIFFRLLNLPFSCGEHVHYPVKCLSCMSWSCCNFIITRKPNTKRLFQVCFSRLRSYLNLRNCLKFLSIQIKKNKQMLKSPKHLLSLPLHGFSVSIRCLHVPLHSWSFLLHWFCWIGGNYVWAPTAYWSHDLGVSLVALHALVQLLWMNRRCAFNPMIRDTTRMINDSLIIYEVYSSWR